MIRGGTKGLEESKCHCNLQKKGKEEDPGSYKPVNITFNSRKISEQIFPEAISKHLKDKKVTGSSQHGFTKGKSCLANLEGLQLNF